MHIQINDDQVFSQFDMLIASIVTGNTIGKLESLAPKIRTDYFEDEKFISRKRYNDFKDKIEKFTNLLPNWDSYNADVVSRNAIGTAIETLNHLSSKGQLTNGFTVNIFPMRDGGIQFEFDGENIIAELEISPNGELTLIYFDDEGTVIGEPQELFELSELSTILEEAEYA